MTRDDTARLEENLWSFWRHFGMPEGAALHETDALTWFETPIAALPYNAVLRTHIAGDPAAQVDEIFAHFERARKPFFWLIHPSVLPHNMVDVLRARGFEEVDMARGMVGNMADLPQAGELAASFRVQEVGTGEEFKVMVDFIIERWHAPTDSQAFFEELGVVHRVGLPGAKSRAWVVWEGDKALAKAVTFEDNGVIGLHGVATRAEARGKGLARFICLHALQETDRGRGLPAVLHSSPMAVSLYEKMGFTGDYPFRLFAVPDSMHI